MAAQRDVWTGQLHGAAFDILANGGAMVVTPTKVGYIVMTTDHAGLVRKFEAKERALGKPAVVLCGSLAQLRELAQLNPEIEAFYERHWREDVLLGCILPWRPEVLAKLPAETRALVTDARATSCFVIRFGTPGEQLAAALWTRHGLLSFASSANPSGKGNRGLSTGVGERIEQAADLIVEADAYVASNQPGLTANERREQGVMVAMVDGEGNLVPEQRGQRSVSPHPVLIRAGLDVEKIMAVLAEHFPSWDYRHGEYY